MIWSKDDRKGGGRAYHHGNLREALVRAALDLILKKGPAGFTFAEAARSAGVSPAAPYRGVGDVLGLPKLVWRRRLVLELVGGLHSDEVIGLRREATALKEVVADLTLENRLLKKSVTADGEDGE